MTGRDLILYIVSNHLEDTEFFTDGRLPGFMTVEETAVKMGVGQATVLAWVSRGQLAHIKIGDVFYIPANNDVVQWVCTHAI